MLRSFSITVASALLLLAIGGAAHAQSCAQQCNFAYISCLEKKFTSTLMCQQLPPCRAGCLQHKKACVSSCPVDPKQRGR
jgi:hypothetical protein